MYLTRRQKEILEVVRGFIDREGYSPSLQEIAAEMGLSSVATVHKHLKNLEEKGHIVRDAHRGRSVRMPEPEPKPPAEGERLEVPFLGLIAAGQPIEALENPETVQLPESMLGRGETFVLKVEGDSMIEEGIMDGDMIIVESREQADRGEVVVALVDGEAATVKRFFPEGESVRLQPANREMAPQLYPANRVRIQGVVIGLMRKFS